MRRHSLLPLTSPPWQFEFPPGQQALSCAINGPDDSSSTSIKTHGVLCTVNFKGSDLVRIFISLRRASPMPATANGKNSDRIQPSL